MHKKDEEADEKNNKTITPLAAVQWFCCCTQVHR